MALTANGLVRELGRRRHELYLSTPTAAGSTTTLIDQALLQHFPEDVNPFNAWVRGSVTADVANRGVERRSSRWAYQASTLHFPYAFPAATTTGEYEIYTRTSYNRLLAAINAGVAAIGRPWGRPVLDDTVVGVAETWKYTLPSGVNWIEFSPLEIQILDSAASYPYTSAVGYSPRIYPVVSSAGVTTWYLQFGRQPPVGSIIRVYGRVQQADLVADADVLPVEGRFEGRVREYLMMHARHALYLWEADAEPIGKAAYAERVAEQSLLRAREAIFEGAPGGGTIQIQVPGRGGGQVASGSDEAGYLAAHNTMH